MAEGLDLVYETIDRQHAGESAHTRRRLVAGAAAALGGMGLLALPGVAGADPATPASFPKENTPERILTVAATAEVLATIVNTVGFEADIWIPDAVFADRTSFLSTLEVGDQIFCNAYLIGTAAFGFAGLGQQAVVAAEFMGVEAVHRALARQSLGKLGNDRVFIRADNREEAPDAGRPGREHPLPGPDPGLIDAVSELPASAPGARGVRRRAERPPAATRYNARPTGFSRRSRMWPRNCAASAP